MTTTEDVIRAAASVGRDVAEGRLTLAALDAAVADECRQLFGVVAGPEDALWSLHTDVCRQAISLGALSADELSEWVAVFRAREVAASGCPGVPAEAESSARGPHSPENDGSASDAGPSSDI